MTGVARHVPINLSVSCVPFARASHFPVPFPFRLWQSPRFSRKSGRTRFACPSDPSLFSLSLFTGGPDRILHRASTHNRLARAHKIHTIMIPPRAGQVTVALCVCVRALQFGAACQPQRSLIPAHRGPSRNRTSHEPWTYAACRPSCHHTYDRIWLKRSVVSSAAGPREAPWPPPPTRSRRCSSRSTTRDARCMRPRTQIERTMPSRSRSRALPRPPPGRPYRPYRPYRAHPAHPGRVHALGRDRRTCHWAARAGP